MSPDEDPRTRLNNFCQHLKLGLRFEDTEKGPQNQPTWECVAYVSNVNYGEGTGSTKGEARAAAAKAALTQMHEKYPGYDF